MNLEQILTAFGEDERLPYASLARRMNAPDTRHGSQRFAKMAREHLGIRPQRQRYEGKVRQCYIAAQFRLVAKQSRPLTPEQVQPTFGSYEVLRMNLKAKTAILAYRDSEMKKLQHKNAALTAELRRMRTLLSRFSRAAAAMAVGITPMQPTESVARAL